MRFRTDQYEDQGELQLAGSLALAHPTLRDPNFVRSVVLVTAHSSAGGTLGVIVNKPLGQTLSEYKPEMIGSEFADVPLYDGGPVAADQLILVAWRWNEEEGSFQLYFGIDESKASKLMSKGDGFQLRGFMGHSGWGEGQIEGELEEGSWVISPLQPDIETEQGVGVWRSIIGRISPEMYLLAEEPEDPSVN